MKSITFRIPTTLADRIGRFAEGRSQSDALRELIERGLHMPGGDGFTLGTLGGEPVKLRPVSVPRSLRNHVEGHARHHTGGDLGAAVAELLERGLHHHFMERVDSMLAAELEPLTLAAQRQKGKR